MNCLILFVFTTVLFIKNLIDCHNDKKGFLYDRETKRENVTFYQHKIILSLIVKVGNFLWDALYINFFYNTISLEPWLHVEKCGLRKSRIFA